MELHVLQLAALALFGAVDKTTLLLYASPHFFIWFYQQMVCKLDMAEYVLSLFLFMVMHLNTYLNIS